MKKTVLSLLVFITAAADCFAAEPRGEGFYAGAEYGASALNNDVYIYSGEANARQPEMNIRQSNESAGHAEGIYAGYNFASLDTGFLGASKAQFGIQIGYTDLGEYKINTSYYSSTSTVLGYRKTEEHSEDMALVSTLYWDNGFNIFLKAGVARLHGKYTQENLIDVRQPETVPEKESLKINVIRPELAVGAGKMLTKNIGIYAQYAIIFGGSASDGAGRFGTDEMTQTPNTLYRAERLTLGTTFYF